MNSSLMERMCELPDLEAEAFRLLQQIPAGTVSTYGDLARALGDERTSAARWLGELLKNHEHDTHCVCHRVVRSNGEIGHYVSGDSQEKRQLLVAEGVDVSEVGKIDIRCRYQDFESSQPFKALKEFQLQLIHKYEVRDSFDPPTTIAGVDCAYQDKATAIGAYVELNAKTLEVIYEKRISVPVEFPYIPGYLTFRELPTLLTLLEAVRVEREFADVIFVDGNGTLHPWRAGIATCLGVLIEHPTLGIGKSLLCGSVDLSGVSPDSGQPVIHSGETIGNAILSKIGSKPVFVSSGQFLSIQTATEFAHQAMGKHRVPEPIFFADRLSKQRGIIS